MSQNSDAAVPSAEADRPIILIIGQAATARARSWLAASRESGATLVFVPLTREDADAPYGVPISSRSEASILESDGFGVWAPATAVSPIQARRKNQSYAKLGRWVSAAISELRPVHVHATDVGLAGLAVAAVARKGRLTIPTLSVSNWQGDFEWYSGIPQHQEAIVQLLEMAAHFLPEGKDDERLAVQLGFAGEIVEPSRFPAFVSDASSSVPIPPSRRRDILFDCRHTFPLGDSHLLSAAYFAASHLRSHRIRVLAGQNNTEPMFGMLMALGMEIEIAPIPSDNEAVMAMLMAARAIVGVRVSDVGGLNLFAAMEAGTFPVMTDRANSGDWVVDGTSALLGSHHDIAANAQLIQRAVQDDALVDGAASRNLSTLVKAHARSAQDCARDLYQGVQHRSEGTRVA